MSGHRTFHVFDALEASPARTRRIWSQAAKDLILAEASVPGANVSAVARAHGVSVSQVFHWRREAQKTTRIAASGAMANTSTEPTLSFVEMTSAPKAEFSVPISTDVCEIIVAGIALRIGSSVPAKRVAELIRAARLA
jgi:transposase